MASRINLRGCDPIKLYEKYMQGNIILNPSSEKIKNRIAKISYEKIKVSSYHIFSNFSDSGLSFVPKICQWCRSSFTHNPIGIPINFQPKEKQEIGKDLVEMESCFCCYECCLAEIVSSNKKCYDQRSDKYIYSETILRYLFKTNYPGENLKKANDWKLLNINGGPLTKEKYINGEHIYIPISSTSIQGYIENYLVLDT